MCTCGTDQTGPMKKTNAEFILSTAYVNNEKQNIQLIGHKKKTHTWTTVPNVLNGAASALLCTSIQLMQSRHFHASHHARCQHSAQEFTSQKRSLRRALTD